MVILTCGIGRKLETLKPCGYYDRVLRPVSILVALLAALLFAGCGGSDASKEEFAGAMVSARNDADAGLAQIVEAGSWEDLMARMKVAAVEVRRAAGDVRKADAPSGLEDERDLLADRLIALSDEIISTVETFEAFPDQAQATRALNFEQWNSVQASLASLRREGVKVRALERHKPELQRQ
jgi:hypothetical protein